MSKYLTVNNISEEIFVLIHGLIECKHHGEQQQMDSLQPDSFYSGGLMAAGTL